MTPTFYLRNTKHWIKRLLRRAPAGRITIGRHTYGAPRIRWWGEDASLRIGSFCSIAERVEIYLGGNHRTDWVTTFPFSTSKAWPQARGIAGHPHTRGDVVIGNDVWLGAGCVILSGVTIGDGAVVGARAVVSRDVPAYGIATGNPATLMRMRFEPPTIERLRACAWWDWDDAEIRDAMHLLLSDDIEGFLRAAEQRRAAHADGER